MYKNINKFFHHQDYVKKSLHVWFLSKWFMQLTELTTRGQRHTMSLLWQWSVKCNQSPSSSEHDSLWQFEWSALSGEVSNVWVVMNQFLVHLCAFLWVTLTSCHPAAANTRVLCWKPVWFGGKSLHQLIVFSLRTRSGFKKERKWHLNN